MGKPNGIALEMGPEGPRMFVRPIDRVADRIWDAVQDAIAAGWTPKQFKQEVAEAWEQSLTDEAKAAGKELRS